MPLDEILRFFAKYIEKEIGIVYSTHNNFQLVNRLEEISKFMSVNNLEELYQLAQKGINGSFKQLLLDIATNNETSFFRDPKVFRAIECLIQQRRNESPNQPVRIWSAASSTGQEALSVSMIISELNLGKNPPLQYSILASDVCERALQRARQCVYSQLEVQRGLPIQMLVKYFRKDPQDRWLAVPELKSHIQYRKINLNDFAMPTEKFDFILCRNVLIYQSVENKVRVIESISSHLNEGGYLFLGAGESMLGVSSLYEQVSLEGAILYKKKLPQMRAA